MGGAGFSPGTLDLSNPYDLNTLAVALEQLAGRRVEVRVTRELDTNRIDGVSSYLQQRDDDAEDHWRTRLAFSDSESRVSIITIVGAFGHDARLRSLLETANVPEPPPPEPNTTDVAHTDAHDPAGYRFTPAPDPPPSPSPFSATGWRPSSYMRMMNAARDGQLLSRQELRTQFPPPDQILADGTMVWGGRAPYHTMHACPVLAESGHLDGYTITFS
jgi:hypothetical protein